MLCQIGNCKYQNISVPCSQYSRRGSHKLLMMSSTLRDNSYEDHIFASPFKFEVPALASPMKHSRKMFSSKQLTQVDTKMYLREQILQSHKRLLRGACYHWLERMYYVFIMNVSLFMHSDNHIRLHHSDFQNCTKGHLQIM